MTHVYYPSEIKGLSNETFGCHDLKGRVELEEPESLNYRIETKVIWTKGWDLLEVRTM